MKDRDDRIVHLSSDCGGLDSINVKNRDTESLRRKNRDSNSLRIIDKDVDSISNAD
jgi:hypothetical protein